MSVGAPTLEVLSTEECLHLLASNRFGRVAFAADPAGRWGWSVVVQGPAFDITDSPDEHSIALRRLPVEPWAPEARSHWLRITATTVQGRRFGRTAA